jgi:hypothetical protein
VGFGPVVEISLSKSDYRLAYVTLFSDCRAISQSPPGSYCRLQWRRDGVM